MSSQINDCSHIWVNCNVIAKKKWGGNVWWLEIFAVSLQRDMRN